MNYFSYFIGGYFDGTPYGFQPEGNLREWQPFVLIFSQNS